MVSPLYYLAVHRDSRVLRELSVLLGKGVQDAALFKRKTTESDDDGDELAQPIAFGKVYCGGYKDD